MIQRNFWRNVLPSVIAFAFSGVRHAGRLLDSS